MLYTEKEGKTLNLNENLTSDGSELIPAEVQAKIRHDNSTLLKRGYSVDDEGIINSYAVEPATSLAEYPSPQQQRRYVRQGAGATLLISLTLLIAFAVS
ncbi:MAG: photosystem II assembly protein Psb34 [Microcystaceae cyanobacterium]